MTAPQGGGGASKGVGGDVVGAVWRAVKRWWRWRERIEAT